MSETLNTDKSNQASNDSLSELENAPSFAEHMRALEAEKPQGKVIASGEVSKLIKQPNGKHTLASEYLSLYDSYKDNCDPHNKESKTLGNTIWSLGHNLAILDLDESTVTKLSTGAIENIDDDLGPDSARLYKKTINGLLDMVDSDKVDSVKQVVEKMRETGKAGEYFAEMFESLEEEISLGIHTSKDFRYDLGSPDSPETKNESNQTFDSLERTYAELLASGKINPEEINALYAGYSDLLKTTFDPEAAELIEERIRTLSNLSDKFEDINLKTASFDD